jgi:hypothetical protein
MPGEPFQIQGSGTSICRIVATEDDSRPYVRTRADDKALQVAIDDYKAALVPETTALP